MSLTVLCPMPRFAEFSSTGMPLAGGKLYTAQPATVAGPGQSFPKSTYTDSTGQTANSNPVILDAAGRADVWLSGAYAVALYDEDDVLVYTADAVSGIDTGSVGATTQIFGDASVAIYNANILAADDPLAPAYYEIFKTDASANAVRVTPAAGTVRGQAYIDLDVQGVGVRLVRSESDNNWYRA
jgi:hypothetical protein